MPVHNTAYQVTEFDSYGRPLVVTSHESRRSAVEHVHPRCGRRLVSAGSDGTFVVVDQYHGHVWAKGVPSGKSSS